MDVHHPLLHLIGGYNRLELEGDAYRPSEGNPVYQVVINGTGHAYFSDLIYIYRHYADAEWQRRHRFETEPHRVIQITRDYLSAFFGRYLGGEADNVLLAPKKIEPSTSGLRPKRRANQYATMLCTTKPPAKESSANSAERRDTTARECSVATPSRRRDRRLPLATTTRTTCSRESLRIHSLDQPELAPLREIVVRVAGRFGVFIVW